MHGSMFGRSDFLNATAAAMYDLSPLKVGKNVGKPCLAKSLATEGDEIDWPQGWEGKL
jgi:hypothetical protein